MNDETNEQVDARPKSAEQLATEAHFQEAVDQPLPSAPTEWRDTSQDAAPIDGGLATEPQVQEVEPQAPDFEQKQPDVTESSSDSDNTGAFPVTTTEENADAC